MTSQSAWQREAPKDTALVVIHSVEKAEDNMARQTKGEGHPLKTSAKFSDFLIPFPLGRTIRTRASIGKGFDKNIFTGKKW